MKERLFAQTAALVIDHATRHPSFDGVLIHAQQHTAPTPPTADQLKADPEAAPTTRILGGDEVRAPESEIDALMAAKPPKSLADLDLIFAKWLANHTQTATKLDPKPRPPKIPKEPKNSEGRTG